MARFVSVWLPIDGSGEHEFMALRVIALQVGAASQWREGDT
ncbi:hypothetical protein [Halomonas llamarensis]|nr:hypothetical protein [Halomonas llamarensis]